MHSFNATAIYFWKVSIGTPCNPLKLISRKILPKSKIFLLGKYSVKSFWIMIYWWSIWKKSERNGCSTEIGHTWPHFGEAKMCLRGRTFFVKLKLSKFSCLFTIFSVSIFYSTFPIANYGNVFCVYGTTYENEYASSVQIYHHRSSG